MRNSLFALPCLVLLLMGPLVADESVRVDAIQRTQDGMMLSWKGGGAPFTIQESPDLVSWEDLGASMESQFLLPKSELPLAFYRVEGTPDLGEYVGQWRVAEGEFGHALAKHRLKSIWEFYLPKGESFATAKSFFSAATLKLSYLEAGEMKSYTGSFAGLPNSEVTSKGREMSVAWTWGEGDWKRDLTLTMSFRYDVEAIRFSSVNLSDPQIELVVNYEVPKLNMDESRKVTMIKEEECTLVEVDDVGDRPNWWNRSMAFSQGGVTIDSDFQIGVPLIEGGPAFIFKTPLLVDWGSSTITGLTSESITLTDRFSQTYFPFHHNFVETLWLEPALEPGIDPAILAELQEMNIRFIVPVNPSAFPEQKPSLGVVGFDDVFRSL